MASLWTYPLSGGEITPEPLIAPLKGDRPDLPFNVLHDVDIATLNIVLDSLAESKTRQPLSLKPLRG
jgi:hypothetical protein